MRRSVSPARCFSPASPTAVNWRSRSVSPVRPARCFSPASVTPVRDRSRDCSPLKAARGGRSSSVTGTPANWTKMTGLPGACSLRVIRPPSLVTASAACCSVNSAFGGAFSWRAGSGPLARGGSGSPRTSSGSPRRPRRRAPASSIPASSSTRAATSHGRRFCGRGEQNGDRACATAAGVAWRRAGSLAVIRARIAASPGDRAGWNSARAGSGVSACRASFAVTSPSGNGGRPVSRWNRVHPSE
jgi:hypothetical protein